MLAYYPVAWELRPQSFAFPLFVATLWLVLADARRPSPLVFAALPLIALWTNLHGSVVLGAALVSLHGLVTILRKRRPSPRGLALLLAPWACIFASPYAAHLPAYYEKILVGGHFRQFLTEWAPTTLTPITAPAYLLLLGGLWLLGRAGRNVPLLDKLVFVGAALLAFQAVRNVGWIALVAVVVLPQFLDRLRGPAFEPRRLNRFLALTMLAAVVAAVASVAAKPADWFTTKFPAGAAQAATRTAGAHGRVFATAPYADWLLWTHPELAGRIAFDGRYELLSRTQLQQLARFETRIGNWLAPVHGYRVFVLDRQSERPLARALVRALPARVIFSSPQVVVLERRTSSRP
jgi:hypothetical protein